MRAPPRLPTLDPFEQLRIAFAAHAQNWNCFGLVAGRTNRRATALRWRDDLAHESGLVAYVLDEDMPLVLPQLLEELQRLKETVAPRAGALKKPPGKEETHATARNRPAVGDARAAARKTRRAAAGTAG